MLAARRAGVAVTLHSYRADPRAASYGAEAAQVLGERLGVQPERVLKTLVARTGSDPYRGLAVAVLPVTCQLDLKALARALGTSRASMAERAEAERASGYVTGGISPIGQRRALPTVVDVSATAHGTVLVSAGRRGLEIELAPGDLVRLTDALVAPIAHP